MARPRPIVLFAHGAGAPSTSEWMEGWASRLAPLGEVVRFDYRYMREGRRSPDRQPKLLAAHREALAAARGAHPRRRRVILAGKSMGARMGCHLSTELGAGEPLAEELGVELVAVVCLGYPLVSAFKGGAMRDAILREMRAPVIFVQGTRDKLCPLDRLAGVRKGMKAKSALHVVETGDHSLRITKTHTKQTGTTQDDADAAAFAAIAQFVKKVDG